VLFNHLVEVAAPFFYFLPQPASAIAGILVVLFQGALLVSGNFSWLSMLTLILAFSTFDDALLGRFLPFHSPPLAPQAQFNQGVIWGVALLVALLSVKPVRNLFSRNQIMNTNYNPYHLVNTYGAFGSITRERYEIVLEGTDETVITAATHWKEYGFRGKPGDPCGMPPQIAPYHLRLDWLMWFAAMPSPYYDPWFIRLLAKLLEGDAPTLSLLRTNPFPDAPPVHVRALHYRYRFTTPEERKRTGCWWQRELAGIYFPPISLKDPVLRSIHQELQ
jgi:lipase maturation factor